MASPTILLSVNRQFRGKVKHKAWEKHTRSFQQELLDVQGIAECIAAGYSIAAAHHTRRSRANYTSAQFLGLDFDTEDERSSLHGLLHNQFIGDYAAIVHTTSSHQADRPRARAFFVLDEPVEDAAQYVDYAKALNWMYECTDTRCAEAARCWFGAVDCDIVVRDDRVLPLAVLDDLVEKYRAAQPYDEAAPSPALDIDVQRFVARSIQQSSIGTRNSTGFQLACILRDIGLNVAEAEPWMRLYQQSVAGGPHPYTVAETMASLHSAYTRPPRRQDVALLEYVARVIEYIAWEHSIGLKQGATHYSLKTVYAVVDIALKVGRTTQLALPVRGFNEYGIPKATAANHLAAMCDAGLLRLRNEADGPRAARYDIHLDNLLNADVPVVAFPQFETPCLTLDNGFQDVENRNLAPPPLDSHCKETPAFLLHDCPTVAQLPEGMASQAMWFHQLQSLPHFRHRAAIDPALWPKERKLSDYSLGPAVQRLIAALTKGTARSKRELMNDAKVNSRTGNRKLKLLGELGILTYELNSENESAHMPRLVEDWYERLMELAPALTTYGHEVLHAEKADLQRLSFHSHQKFSTPEDEAIGAAAAQNAKGRLLGHQRRKEEMLRMRRARAAALGITSVPPLALRPRPAGSGRRRQAKALTRQQQLGALAPRSGQQQVNAGQRRRCSTMAWEQRDGRGDVSHHPVAPVAAQRGLLTAGFTDEPVSMRAGVARQRRGDGHPKQHVQS